MASEALTIPNDSDERVIATQKSANELLEIADTIIVDSGDMNELANETLSSIHLASKELEKRKATVLDPLSTAVKAVRALFSPAEDALDTAKATIKRKIGGWLDAQEKLRLAAEFEAAIKQGAQIAEAEAELKRVAALAPVSLADDAILREVREQAVANLQALEVFSPMVYAPVAGDMGSNSSSKRFKADVTDLPALLRYLADDLESETPKFDNTVDIKIGQLKAFGNATKGLMKIPGVTWVQERSITARA